MQIQNFKFYLQDATNFFSVLDYKFYSVAEDELKHIKRSLFNWFYDPIKINGKCFFVERDSFTVRSVVDKADSDKALIEVFDAVVRYYTFQQFVDYFGYLKFSAVKNRNQYILKVKIGEEEYKLAEVNLIKSRSKGIIETVLFDSRVIGLLNQNSIAHLDPEELDRLGEDEDGDPVPVDDDFQNMLKKRYCFDEYMGEDEPSKRVVVTGGQILELYWEFWKEQMVNRFGEGSELINFKNCIDDYCVVNWAWEVDGNGNKI